VLACFDPIIEALEEFLDALAGGGATGASTPPGFGFHPDCEPRTAAELATGTAGAAAARIAGMYPPAAGWLTSLPPMDVRRFSGSNRAVGGRTARHAGPNFDFLIELNVNRHVSSYFDLALSLVHELAHVQRATSLGFLPEDVVTLTTEDEFVGLGWSFELAAFTEQLRAAEAICFDDLAARRFDPDYGAGWELSVPTDDTLTALHAGDVPLARRCIRDVYSEADARTYWSSHHGGTPPSTAVQAFWSLYAGLHTDEFTTAWGFS
jgi:hypothetical protein